MSARRSRSLVRRALAVLAIALFVVAAGSGSRLAFAAPRPDVSVRVSDDHPTVGDAFDVEMTVASDQAIGSVSAPGLQAPVAFVVNGPSMSTSTSMQFKNGVQTSHSRVVLRWRLTAIDPGVFTIPGPTVNLGGRVVQGKPITITVEKGSGASHGLPTDYLHAQDTDDSINRELALDSAPDDDLFIHAIPDKKSAIVGEQVTVSFYVYFRVDFAMTEHKEASLADFLRIPLLTDPSSTSQQTTLVGSKRFGVRLIDRVAAFPLRAGKLKTGSVSARFSGRRLGANVQKVSDEAVIDVTEPPEVGRPVGYVMGTVGKFDLQANIAPRSVDQNGSVSVTVTLSGIGNLPSILKMPQQQGVEWLDPQRRDDVTTRDDKVGGTRTFGYVATLTKAGPVDLGSVELPYFDAETRSYETARVSLGTIQVRPAVVKTDDSNGQGGSQPDEDLLAKLPKARTKLTPYEHPEDRSVPAWGLWAAIACPPLLVGFGFFMGYVGTGVVRRRRDARGSSATKVKEALAAARKAEKNGQPKEVSASVERAVHAAIEQRTGLKSRAILLAELGSELESKGVSKELATEVREVFAECELLRFTPSVDDKAMAGLVARATTLTKNLTGS